MANQLFYVAFLLFLLCLIPQFLEAAPNKKAKTKPNSLKHKFKCNQAEEADIDRLVARIMTFGQADRRFPENRAEMKEYCREQKELTGKLEDYKSACLRGRAKQIVAVNIYSMKSTLNSYCKNMNSRKTKSLLSSAACANAASEDYLGCSHAYVDLLLAVTGKNVSDKAADGRQRLGQMCCGYVEVFRCIKAAAGRHEDACSELQIEANANFIRGFFENSVNVICGEFNEGTDKCDKFPMIRLKKEEEGDEKDDEVSRNVTRPLSFFNPIVQVLSNL